MTKDALARALRLPESQIRQWSRDGVFPPHLHMRLEGNRFDYAPVALAFGELVIRLRRCFGDNSPLPVALAKAALPTLERLWQEPAPELIIRHDGMTVTLDTGFIATAKEKFATVAA